MPCRLLSSLSRTTLRFATCSFHLRDNFFISPTKIQDMYGIGQWLSHLISQDHWSATSTLPIAQYRKRHERLDFNANFRNRAVSRLKRLLGRAHSLNTGKEQQSPHRAPERRRRGSCVTGRCVYPVLRPCGFQDSVSGRLHDVVRSLAQ